MATHIHTDAVEREPGVWYITVRLNGTLCFEGGPYDNEPDATRAADRVGDGLLERMVARSREVVGRVARIDERGVGIDFSKRDKKAP